MLLCSTLEISSNKHWRPSEEKMDNYYFTSSFVAFFYYSSYFLLYKHNYYSPRMTAISVKLWHKRGVQDPFQQPGSLV